MLEFWWIVSLVAVEGSRFKVLDQSSCQGSATRTQGPWTRTRINLDVLTFWKIMTSGSKCFIELVTVRSLIVFDPSLVKNSSESTFSDTAWHWRWSHRFYRHTVLPCSLLIFKNLEPPIRSRINHVTFSKIPSHRFREVFFQSNKGRTQMFVYKLQLALGCFTTCF